MAISTFCTTLCALTMLAAVPAPAFALLQDAGPVTTSTTTARDAGHNHATPQQGGSRLLFETDAPIGMAGTDQVPAAQAPGSVSLFNQTGTYFGELIGGDIAFRPAAEGQSEPEPVSLPLLGAAGVALLIAQLRRSRRPAVR
ncbi:hypothetical protein [Pseudoduganella umbonata]|uniref:Uncharacterized protein n=1 Tax=Pseudoduganella umbonata TaxID=864828 RepID=A0A4P8HSZ7_9BURK|nr:hypothetical protein [Pseudoduganella umbonata]MBB3222900.1 hypothetical protein [Pseudoduganella umbonata]QCP13023.1 hypothetical protein FCL38_23200 [Pseudoduganella umbonata]